jgi:hypothetical protein
MMSDDLRQTVWVLHEKGTPIRRHDGEILDTYELYEAPATWLRDTPAHRLHTPASYRDKLEAMDYGELQVHAKKRDLRADGSEEELRDRLTLVPEPWQEDS